MQPADIISIGSSVFGIKGFAAPATVGLTQISPKKASYLPPVAPPPAESPASRAAPGSKPTPAQEKQGSGARLGLLAIIGIILLLIVIVGFAALTAYFIVNGQDNAAVQKPTVVITAPVSGSQVEVNQPVAVQATASDPSGVVRMELWVNGAKIDQTTSPSAQGQPTLTGAMQWVPQAPGSYTLEIKAFNAQNNVNEPATVPVNAVVTESGTPTPTPSPETPTPTVPNGPTIITLTDLNVRSGPGTIYDILGLLSAGASATMTGKDETGQWWQISYEPAAGGVGWVTGNAEFSKVFNVENLPVVPAPPLPTGTPTNTPTPTDTATSTPTPTNTSIPPTSTPTATGTATQPAEQIEFSASPETIEGGECTTVSWNVTGVKAVFYQDQGVPGVDSRKECPTSTTTYTLRVIRQNDQEITTQVTVKVNIPIASAGTVTLNPGDTVDFDSGSVQGNDFKWDVNGATRYFAVMNGAAIAPKPIAPSLDGLSLEQCASANYGEFTYMDGSDVILNPANELTDGRTACFRTNEGRYGKLRFPQFSTGQLQVEWLTWQK